MKSLGAAEPRKIYEYALKKACKFFLAPPGSAWLRWLRLAPLAPLAPPGSWLRLAPPRLKKSTKAAALLYCSEAEQGRLLFLHHNYLLLYI